MGGQVDVDGGGGGGGGGGCGRRRGRFQPVDVVVVLAGQDEFVCWFSDTDETLIQSTSATGRPSSEADALFASLPRPTAFTDTSSSWWTVQLSI